jgi:hypothetical protein
LSGICGVIGLDGRQFTTADLAGVREALRPLGESEGCWEVMAGGCGVAIGVLGPLQNNPDPARDAVMYAFMSSAQLT